MQHRRWVVLIPIALPLAAAIYGNSARYPTKAVAQQCVEIYAEGLPKDARIGHVRQDGRGLVVHVRHLDWTGEIRCLLYRDGSLDDVGTLNRKIEIVWIEPPMPSSP